MGTARSASLAEVLSNAKDRFWSKVERRGDDECWPWTGARKRWSNGALGYGMFVLGGKVRPAHRVAAALAHGPAALSSAVHVPATCRNPICCNPAHLPLVEASEERRTSIASARAARASSVTRSKLDEAAVRDIRTNRGTYEHVRAMMAKYGVAEVTVRQVIGRITWKHVA